MAEIPGGSVEVPSREILVATGSLFIDIDGEMTYVTLVPNRAKRIYAARWQLDNITGENYWSSLYAEFLPPRKVGEIITQLSRKEVLAAGIRGAQHDGIKFPESLEFELIAAEKSGPVSYIVR